MLKTASLLTLASTASLVAQNPFPLPASAGSTTATEFTAPFVIPTRMTQTPITNRNILMTQGLHASLINWDMIALDPSGRFIFVPCENFGGGAGVFRYDTLNQTHVELMRGNGAGVSTRNPNPATFDATTDEFAAFDPCTWTPWGTIICGEETTGGRFFEVTNPLAPTGPFNVIWHDSIIAVSHEGMRFDGQGNMYFVDEDNSGCIYKFVPTVANDLSAGQTFVLSIDAYATSPNAMPQETFSSTSNRLTTRVGPATWVPLTDINGLPLTTTNPYSYVTANSGRLASDEVVGTPFGRPEDADVKTLASGRECLLVALTSENRVIGIELLTSTTAMVRDFVNYDTINLATGTDINPLQSNPWTSPGSGFGLQNPDNLAVDAFGNVFVIEDNNPGDIWKCIDADNDGVAEAMGLFVTLGVGGSEPTGLIADPANPYRMYCCVQHPSSGADAIWRFTTRPYAGSNADFELATGINGPRTTGPGEFVKAAAPFAVANIGVDSPNNTLVGRPYTVCLQVFTTSTGVTPFLPPLWMNLYQPIIPLFGGPAGQFLTVLPPGGSNTGVQVPPGLAGLSVMIQGIAINASGALVLTDGHEVILR